MSTKIHSPRWKVVVDGKWTGGSFGSEAEANAAAAQFKGSSVKVMPKGHLHPEPKTEEQPKPAEPKKNDEPPPEKKSEEPPSEKSEKSEEPPKSEKPKSPARK